MPWEWRAVGRGGRTLARAKGSDLKKAKAAAEMRLWHQPTGRTGIGEVMFHVPYNRKP